MEFKKKTIIWEDNNEPPKDYIWIKPDGKAYEFDYTDRIWKESKLIKAEESGGSDGGGSGGEDTSEESFLFQVLTILNSTEGFCFDEDINQNYVFPISDWDDSWAEGSTLLGDKETADYVISGYNADDNIGYYIFVTTAELNILKELYYPYKNYYNDWRENQFAFPIDLGTNIAFNNGTPYINYIVDNKLYNKPGCLFDNHEFAYCVLFGIANDYKLGPEFSDGVNYESVEPKFSFRPESEGTYDGFVYMNHSYIQRVYTVEQQNAIYNLFESFSQRAYLASSTQYYDIYIVELSIRVGSNINMSIYTPYVVKKQV